MNQLTLRQIPKRLEKGLRMLARQRGQSLNKTAIHLLAVALGIEKPKRKRRDLSELAGSWTEEEAQAFDENVRIFEEIDEEVWK